MRLGMMGAAVKIGSLFSGYGGLDIATSQVFAGRVAWVSDIKPAACKLLAHRHPNVPNLGDITKINWASVERVDILTGGFPCQDVSVAGRRAGITAGTRSILWTEMCHAIEQLKPSVVVIENVRGLTSATADSKVEPCPGCVGNRPGQHHLRALGRVLGDLADLGFDAEWRGLRASDIGAPHQRFRIFIVATPAPYTSRVAREGWWWTAPTEEATGRAYAESERRTAAPLKLLPTPRTSTGSSATETKAFLAGDRFGIYAAAVARWEQVTGFKAPHHLHGSTFNPRFVEWMMGLPPGWVCDVPGITKTEAISLLGDGVVPQQAFAAISPKTYAAVASRRDPNPTRKPNGRTA